MAAVDPAGARMWRDGAAEYQDLLRAVDADIREMVAAVPETDRKLVTNHDSIRYFADAYDFTIVATVIPGTSTLAEPSASDLADLIEIIHTEGIQVIFADTTRPTRLAEVVAAEAGPDVAVVELFTGALGGPDTGANTYLDYLQTNARLIVQALGR
jgi:zinc/manganese transport system substrate-binding protein